MLTTHVGGVKGRALRRDLNAPICVDDQEPPYSYVMIEGRATLLDDPGAFLRWATAIGGRYMGAENAERFGDFHACGVNASVLIRGVGQGQRMLDQSGMKACAIMAPAGAVAGAVVEAVTKDKAELVIQPGPAACRGR